MKLFGLTGVAGYIAPRHLKAIHDTGNKLVAALDPHDSVGILDRYSRDVAFFTEFERFDRHLERIKRDKDRQEIDFLSICSPNYLHDAHIRLALRLGANAICEKPLVTNPWQLDALQMLEEVSPGKVYNVLQLRVHPSILALKEKIDNAPESHRFQVVLTYVTSRGPWYLYSWKGDVSKSGGIATNIGIHFFDLLLWLFGEKKSSQVFLSTTDKMSGIMELKRADVQWFLSIDRQDLPSQIREAEQPTFRSITVDDQEVEFSGGFTDLHTRIYEEVLAGNGFGMEVARPSIELVYQIRTSEITAPTADAHSFLTNKF